MAHLPGWRATQAARRSQRPPSHCRAAVGCRLVAESGKAAEAGELCGGEPTLARGQRVGAGKEAIEMGGVAASMGRLHRHPDFHAVGREAPQTTRAGGMGQWPATQ